MSRDDQIRWDKQHANSGKRAQPANFLEEIIENESWAISRGKALDIACGKGRNALFLAERGFDVVAVDVSPVALNEGQRLAKEKSLTITWQQADLESRALPEARFDVVIDFNYLQRSLIPQLKAAVKRGGFFIFETFLIDQQTLGHPSNPDYLLRHNELLNFCRDLRVLFYREGKFRDGSDQSFRAGILAQKIL
ncbi:MAG: class I SAM-dependent methyltransferase [Candidatus Binatia bacterium]